MTATPQEPRLSKKVPKAPGLSINRYGSVFIARQMHRPGINRSKRLPAGSAFFPLDRNDIKA